MLTIYYQPRLQAQAHYLPNNGLNHVCNSLLMRSIHSKAKTDAHSGSDRSIRIPRTFRITSFREASNIRAAGTVVLVLLLTIWLDTSEMVKRDGTIDLRVVE